MSAQTETAVDLLVKRKKAKEIAEVERLRALNAELLEALTKLSERVMDCMGDCPHSVVNLAKDAQALISKARS